MTPLDAMDVPASMPETPVVPPARAGGGGVEFAIGVLNGVVGDYLHRSDNGLATPMELFHDGHPLALDRESLRRAYPHSRGRLALWVHGLAVTEAVWSYPEDPATTYGAQLECDHGFTPLYLRYNTGLHISDNGESLARLLEELVAAFPVPVEELVLVGYSMGGLVVRSACHVAAEAGQAWLSRVRRAVYIGVPHLGSPVERVGRAVSWVLRNIPNAYTQLIADVADLRSGGVKDLGAPLSVPLLPGISHHLLVGALAARERHFVCLLFGDGVVPLTSAAGRAGDAEHDLLVTPENVRVIPGVHHVALAHDARVYAQLQSWFEEASP
ncbi:esterase/lipase family protein [Pyxidicoccus sp. MSG2]|uniref:esterase/lipase family protein n=1 Tax=Pyxidicoccus sp. MSG2 TaxID=2996790 RepID=UPI00227002EA|nr:alpha/beta hydrolase [Pyxidicoccus sp. MSG2]MCY1021656.1 alpha/beta hydrolase [Pyxidicoccus sp. MSG2]